MHEPKRKQHFEEKDSDSFTSMIDVVFLLLIFFMLMPFKSPEKKLDIPFTDGTGDFALRFTVNLEIQGQGDSVTYRMNGEDIGSDPRAVGVKVRRLAPKTDTRVVFDAEKAVSYRSVLLAYDSCLDAGLTSLNFKYR